MVAKVNYKRDVTNVRIILVIGPSGAGKSTALNALEDAGFSAVDNLPLSMIAFKTLPFGSQRVKGNTQVLK